MLRERRERRGAAAPPSICSASFFVRQPMTDPAGCVSSLAIRAGAAV